MNNRMIGVIGSGSWGTAIVKILLENSETHINWWVRSEETCNSLEHNGRNPRHLSEVRLDPTRIHTSTSLESIILNSSLLLLAIPSAYLHTTLSHLPQGLLGDKRIVSLVKGSIPEYCLSVSLYLEKVHGVPKENICIVSGPSHAEEVGNGMPTFLTIATRNNSLALEVEQALRCPYIHTSLTHDIDGIERCGLGKNVYAIAAGICQGLGYGDNLNAVVTLAAAKEMQRILEINLPDKQRDFNMPCYWGDLMVTCWSRHSRNRSLGEALAKGIPIGEDSSCKGTLPEGYYSVKTIHKRAVEQHIEATIPIAEAIYRILYEGADPKKEMDFLIDHLF